MGRDGDKIVNPFASGKLSGETIPWQTDVPYKVDPESDRSLHRFEIRPGSFTPKIDTSDPYGTFEVKADGSWTFTLKNNRRLVQGLSDDDTRCRAFVVQPANGGATVTVKIIVQGANDPPTSLTLTWVAPVTRVSDEVGSIPVKTSTASNVKVANLEVESKDNKLPTFGVTGADARRFVIVGSSLFWRAGKSLSKKPEYKFILLATSGIVEILSSEKTLRVGPSAPSAPAEPTVTPGNEQLRVRWTAPSTNGADITDYDVRWQGAGGWNDHELSTISTSLSATITGLTNGDSYDVQVRATNSVGSSGWSTAATGTPGRAVPDPPDALALKPGNTQLEVSWSAPSGNGIAISGYNVQYRRGSSGGWNNHASPGADDTSTTITGLTNNQLYRVRVRARNSVGAGSWASAPGTPVAQPPDVPAKPTLTPGNAQLTVRWTEPSTNGDSITDYDVEYRLTTSSPDGAWTPHNPFSTSDTSLSVTITDLTNGQSYQVRVLAASLAGSSDWSPFATGTLEAREPDVPAKPTLTLGNGQLGVRWIAPSENGADISDYDVQWQGTGGWINHELSTISTSLSTTITGLSNGQSYKVRVRARNSLGTSGWSTAATGTPALQPPDRPAKPTVTAGNLKLEVSWSAPAQNDAPISGYKVRYRSNAPDDWKDHPPLSALFTTITGLSNGRYYQVQVRATSSVGDSDWSESTIGAVGEAPGRPDAPTVTEGNRKLVVEWTAPAENHFPISIYKVRYRPGTSGDWLPYLPSGAYIRPYTIIVLLTNGQSYQVQVLAVSLAGDSEWSESATGTPAAQAPDVPAKPTLTPGNRKLEVEWIAPSNNGASITDYDVRYKPSSSLKAVCSPGILGADGSICSFSRDDDDWSYHKPLSASTSTSITITNLINGLGYAVEVRASNSVGTSKWSRAATGTPGIPAAQAPDAPAEPTLTLGNGQLGVRWITPSSNGARITGYDVQYKLTSATTWTNLRFVDVGTIKTIPGLTNGDSYDVQVRARNSVGNSGWSDSATGTPAAQVPDVPAKPTVKPGNAELVVEWTKPVENGARITDYDVRYQPTSATTWTYPEFTGVGTSTTITGLTNGLNYTVQVLAHNSVGNSGWSDSATGTPAPQVPDRPAKPTLTAGNAELVVEWTKPAENGAFITDYDVRYKPTNAAPWTYPEFTGTGTSTTITGLTNGQNYAVEVRATNSVGTTDWSTAATGTPAAQVPDAPGMPTVNPGDRKLVVKWTAPSDNGARITDYNVQYRQGTGIWLNYEDSIISTSLSTTITGLTNGQVYWVRVRAVNSVDPGSWSLGGVAEPAAQPPDAPERPTLTPGNAELVVKWTKPAENGAEITDYDVQYKQGTGNWLDYELSTISTSLSTTITGLTNGQVYWVRVRAVNSVDPGSWSPRGVAEPGAQAPDVPAEPTLTLGNGQLGVRWITPSSNGAHITGYDVQYKLTSATTWTNLRFVDVGTIKTIPGLTNGDSYDVQVRARNSVGNSGWSDSATGTPAAQVPDVPAKPTVKPGNAELVVEWTKPVENGARITDYDVRYQPTSATTWTYPDFTGVGTSTTITGLTNGLNYTVQVLAHNSVGNSGWSDSATGTPAPQVPDRPAKPTLTPGNAELVVEWTKPAENGDSITDYDVQYKQGAGNWNDHELSTISTALSTTITGLTNGQSYDVQVLARSLAGDSEWSESTTGIPAAQAPDAPAEPTLTLGNGQLGVRWITPSSNGAHITGYDVQYKLTSATTWTNLRFVDVGTIKTIPGLTNGDSYDVQVRARNSVGNSGWSDSATGTPAAQVPDVPAKPTVKPGNAELVVEWTKPVENGARITDYDVRYQPTSATTWTYPEFTGVGTSTTITGLTNGLNYTVQVLAHNSVGNSGWSDSATGTPAPQVPDRPAKPTLTGQRRTGGRVDQARRERRLHHRLRRAVQAHQRRPLD